MPANTWIKKHLPQIGLGGVAIGNEFEYVSDEDANNTLSAAWGAGVKYFDVSPWYGLGLAERRYGHFLHNKKREEYVISSKVGKLLKAAKKNDGVKNFPNAGSPNNVIFDYSGDGVKRSIEDSLQRLGIDSLDIVFVHDLSPDNKLLKGKWLEHFAIAEKGAFPVLTKMREEGIIKGWGLGVNTPEPILKTIEVADPNVFLLASQYSLIEHAYALDNVFPKVREKNIALVMGSNLNAGFISGSKRFNYDPKKPIPAAVIKKRDNLIRIAKKHDVDLRTAALQFSLYPDVAAAIIPGAHKPEQVRENVAALKTKISAAFWEELKSEKLIAENAPVKMEPFK